jgi:hypothetical protein
MKWLQHIWRFAVRLAKELSDETGYARHLTLTGRQHSAMEWRAFSDSRHRQKYQNAKCC